jgi:hypothetical protein
VLTSKTTCALLLTACLAACEQNPAGPLPQDCATSGSFHLSTDCAVDGSALRCSAVKWGQARGCSFPQVDVTNRATWSTSDSSAAIIAAPGIIVPIAAGVIRVIAKLDALTITTDPYSMAPNATVERLYRMWVSVRDPSDQGIGNVTVEVTPERGSSLFCNTEGGGGCDDQLFVLPGTIRVRGTKSGYVPAATSAITPSPNDPDLFVVLVMRRE